MFGNRLLLWGSRWLEKRGLGSVAGSLETHAADDGDVDALHAVARRALAKQDIDGALAAVKQALAKSPDDPRLWCTLGAIHRHAREFDPAREAYRRALAIDPHYPQALSNLGEWCLAQGLADEALDWLNRSLEYTPGLFEPRTNKVAALFELGRFDEALAEAEDLVAQAPEKAEAHLNLGNVLVHTGHGKQALKHYKKALQLRPGYEEAHFNLALWGSRDDLHQAIGYMERQLEERGDSIQRLCLLAAAYQGTGELSKAEELCRRVIERQPLNVSAHLTLANCLSYAGDAAAALSHYHQVVEIDGTQDVVASNILFELNNLPDIDRREMFERHQAWAALHEAPLIQTDAFADRNRDPDRKLRIGYVSGDFGRHPVGYLLREVLRHHARDRYEIHCFSMLIQPDALTDEIRAASDVWEEIFLLSDEEAVELIRNAQLDVLVDLSGHTARHRLLVFARRPAPVQASWIGYFHSTGLSSIDYFISDPYTTPPGCGQLFSEALVRLPHTRFCYSPPDYAPEIKTPTAPYVTFGSFNRLPKVNDAVVEAWARILGAVPDSRLVIKAAPLKDDRVRERMTARFAAYGVSSEQLDLRAGSGHGEMLEEYGDIDLALDTFPFNGGMTTMEALWMGVPVLTIEGDTVVSRQTYSALANIGLADVLACSSVDVYVEKAIALANNRTYLRSQRADIRSRLAASPLRQAEQFTRDLETLYRSTWSAWCDDKKLHEE